MNIQILSKDNKAINLVDTSLTIEDGYSCPEPREEYYLLLIDGKVNISTKEITSINEFRWTYIDNSVVAYSNDEDIKDEDISSIVDGEWVTLPEDNDNLSHQQVIRRSAIVFDPVNGFHDDEIFNTRNEDDYYE